jgi:predicted AlkP superfamily phosphohydrolase/phosphomutase
VVIGLDGAAWHLLDPMIERGVMPRLAALRARGASGPLVSTVPTYTPPAWTSAATGVNPGRHGIYGFHVGHAQDVPQKLVHSGRIRSPAIWEIVNRQGARAGIYNLPLTYPPRDVDGWMVSGMMTPGYGQHLSGFVLPKRLEERILSWAPDYVVEIKTSWDQDWRDESLCLRAIESITQRHRVLQGLLEDEPCEVVFTVLETPDRLQHAYYRYMDPDDEMYDTKQAGRIRPFLDRCFEGIDGIVGLLEDYAGEDGGVVVCSDHGFTSWDVSVHTNALLEKWGYLKIKPSARAMQTSLARKTVPIAKRLLPAKFARRAKGRTFAAIDWPKTRAFASPIPMQGIFVNLEGRERMGVVKSAELAAFKDELAGRFESLRGPDGELVTDRVWRSEEVFSGPATGEAPDLMPVLRDHRFELDDEVFHRQPFEDVGHLPRGVHHPHGIGILAGPSVRAGAPISGSVMDITPTLLYMAGLEVPEDLDGSVLVAGFSPGHLAKHPIEYTESVEGTDTTEASPYTDEEEAVIEESLRGLGYL